MLQKNEANSEAKQEVNINYLEELAEYLIDRDYMLKTTYANIKKVLTETNLPPLKKMAKIKELIDKYEWKKFQDKTDGTNIQS